MLWSGIRVCVCARAKTHSDGICKNKINVSNILKLQGDKLSVSAEKW